MMHDRKPTRPCERPSEHPGVDALLPAEIAVKAENVGAKKVRLDATCACWLSLSSPALHCARRDVRDNSACRRRRHAVRHEPARRWLVFSLGLILVVARRRGAFHREHVDGHGACCAQDHVAGDAARVGHRVCQAISSAPLGTAVLVVLSGQYLAAKGQVAEVALSLALSKVALPFEQALFLGVLCNVLVCLAVWLSLGARGTADKVLAVLFPVSAFVAAGFEHSVANMYLVPLGILIKTWAPAALVADLSHASDLATLTWPNFVWALVPVTIGNVIGGGVLVGAVYWFVYLRGERTR